MTMISLNLAILEIVLKGANTALSDPGIRGPKVFKIVLNFGVFVNVIVLKFILTCGSKVGRQKHLLLPVMDMVPDALPMPSILP